MLGGGPALTGSTAFGDSTLLEDELKYRYAANAATRTIAVFTLGKYRCRCLAYCLCLEQYPDPALGLQALQKSLFKRPLPAIVSAVHRANAFRFENFPAVLLLPSRIMRRPDLNGARAHTVTETFLTAAAIPKAAHSRVSFRQSAREKGPIRNGSRKNACAPIG